MWERNYCLWEIFTHPQEKSHETTVSLKTRDCSFECVFVPSLSVAYRREFTSSVTVNMPPWRNMFFFPSRFLIIHFALVTLFYTQIINNLKCWKSGLFHTTSKCLMYRLHSPRAISTTRVLNTCCMSNRAHVFPTAHNISLNILKVNSNGRKQWECIPLHCPHTVNRKGL